MLPLNPFVLWLRTNPRNVWLIAALVVAVLVLTGVYVKGRHDYAKAERARDAVAVQAAIKSNDKANGKASEMAVHDALVRVQKEKELADVVANIPDTVPDAVAVASACVELRQAGVSVADLPACRPAGPRSPAGAVH